MNLLQSCYLIGCNCLLSVTQVQPRGRLTAKPTNSMPDLSHSATQKFTRLPLIHYCISHHLLSRLCSITVFSTVHTESTFTQAENKKNNLTIVRFAVLFVYAPSQPLPIMSVIQYASSAEPKAAPPLTARGGDFANNANPANRISLVTPTAYHEVAIHADPTVLPPVNATGNSPAAAKEKPMGAVSSQQDVPQFLEAPAFHRPNRPLSPDTMSNLSIDEYDQLRPPRQRSPSPYSSFPNGEPNTEKRFARSGLRSRLKAIWIHNLGLVYMLLAQLFGTLMNVTTRVLEVEGNKGKGMHPFQACLSC